MAHRPKPDFISEWQQRGRTLLQTRIAIAEWEAEHLPADQRVAHVNKTIDEINATEARIQEMQRRDSKAAKTVSTITSIATVWAGIPLFKNLAAPVGQVPPQSFAPVEHGNGVSPGGFVGPGYGMGDQIPAPVLPDGRPAGADPIAGGIGAGSVALGVALLALFAGVVWRVA